LISASNATVDTLRSNVQPALPQVMCCSKKNCSYHRCHQGVQKLIPVKIQLRNLSCQDL
jgi:hypothetical protein